MLDSKLIDELFQHMEWADALVWCSVLNSSRTEGDLRIRELSYHIHLTQYAFLHIWRDLPTEFPKLSSFDKLKSISEWGHAYHKQVKDFLNSVIESSLDREVALPWAADIVRKPGVVPQSTTLLQTLIQVSAHSTYHRGQINAHLRQLDDEPPLTDFIAWLWLGKPAAEWPEE